MLQDFQTLIDIVDKSMKINGHYHKLKHLIKRKKSVTLNAAKYNIGKKPTETKDAMVKASLKIT